MSERPFREVLHTKEYIESVEVFSTLTLRDRATTFLFRIYTVLIIATLGIFLLQGFHLWGFNLDLNLIKWLGGAAVGEVAGLAAMVYGFLFRKGKGKTGG